MVPEFNKNRSGFIVITQFPKIYLEFIKPRIKVLHFNLSFIDEEGLSIRESLMIMIMREIESFDKK